MELKNIRIAVSGIYDYALEELPALKLPLPGNGAPKEVAEKRIYQVYRPALVLEQAKDKFKLLPLTHHHPKQKVDGKNFRALTVGYTGENPFIDYIESTNEVGIRSTLVLYDDESLSAYERGEVQLSPGYDGVFEWQSGISPNGQPYDIVMKDIQSVNHLALLPVGRGGKAAVILDSAVKRYTIFECIRAVHKSMQEVTDAEFDESKHKRDRDGKFSGGEKNNKSVTDKLKSVKDIKDDDFTNPTRTVELPSLKPSLYEAMGKPEKAIIIKKNIFEKNKERHKEIKDPKTNREILENALYKNDKAMLCKAKSKPNYWSIVKSGDYYDVAVIDTDDTKDNFELVGWRRIDEKGYEKMIKQMEREDGQFLITDGMNPYRAADLSALSFHSSITVTSNTDSVKSVFDYFANGRKSTVFDTFR